ncbi:MAG: hypothetical protein IKV02_01095, partial [Clostridia bacterium]|nr:hypothetical protein [Clostridia bacterium]
MKRFFKTLVLVSMVAALLLSIASCDVVEKLADKLPLDGLIPGEQTTTVEVPEQPTEPEHQHNYAATVTAPTCEDAGYTTYTCECGESYVGDEVEALGHNYEAVVTAPTCTEAGYTTYTCSVCGDSYVADEV